MLKRAAKDTLSFFGWNKRTFIVPVLLWLLGAIIYYFWQGKQAMLGEMTVAIAFALIPIGIFLLGLFVFHLIRAPIFIRWEKEKENRLIITKAEIHKQGNSSDAHWLRLRVENPSILPIPHCYGKLLTRRLVSIPALVDGQPSQIEVSLSHGQTSSQTRELPPEGHKFPWSTVNTPDIEVVISGYGGFEYLYLVTKNNNSGCFYVPSGMGLMYSNWSIGIFELEIEVGSETETFKPSKARIRFNAASHAIEFVSLDILDE